MDKGLGQAGNSVLGFSIQTLDLAFFLLNLVYLPYGVFRGSVTRRGVSEECWREMAGFGSGGTPSDAKSSSPGFLHLSGIILIGGSCLLPPASNRSWGSYDTSQGRNSNQTHLKH